MAIVTTDAVLLRRREIRETSLLLTCLTRHVGKIVGLLKGVRGARGMGGGGYLEPFTLQTVVFYERPRSDIDLMTQCDLSEPFLGIRQDLAKMAYASYVSELCDHLLQLRDPHPDLFELLARTLTALQESPVPSQIARLFEARLLASSGVLPPLASLPLSRGAALSLEQMLQVDWPQWGRLRMTRPVEEELTSHLQRLLTQHLEVRVKSLEFLHEVGLA